MRPPLSVVFLTTLCGAGQGLFLAIFFVRIAFGHADEHWLRVGALTAAALAALGLLASFFHLGRWRPAWRAASQWRTSWLSREVILLPAFIAASVAYAFLPSVWLGVLAVVICVALFVSTAMIYACLKFLQEWASPFTVANFFLLGTASGFTLASALAAMLAAPWTRVYATCAIGCTLLAAVSRIASLVRNARLRPRSSTQSAIGIAHPRIEQRSRGFTGGSFNTREFFHGRSPATLRVVKWAFVLLAFALPVVLLLLTAPAAAFAVQMVGLVAERWFFFAEANHPQNLYYQAVS